ncbi:unnamed protein product [Blepharisma stoltei]|uniref:Uncharacterized protein n=1 Tax=Blepharisma stoltei TaxID=1481888 RepID=A0AAU9JV28_9CILI|nr:unnamed protein product [Blepharisma stoltei]
MQSYHNGSRNTPQELLLENEQLKAKLLEATTIIDALRKENAALTKRLNSFLNTQVIQGDSTFVTNSGDLAAQCDNCGQEIPRQNIQIHTAQCIRRIKRCQACNKAINISEIDAHMKEQIGEFKDIIADIESNNIESLSQREAHGAKFDIKDDNQNSLLHVASRCGNREIAHFLISRGAGVNSQNIFGETPLHLVCGKNKDIGMVQFLLTQGADSGIVNTIGESPQSIAQRSGFHEASICFSQHTHAPIRPRTSAGGIRAKTHSSSRRGSGPSNNPPFNL